MAFGLVLSDNGAARERAVDLIKITACSARGAL